MARKGDYAVEMLKRIRGNAQSSLAGSKASPFWGKSDTKEQDRLQGRVQTTLDSWEQWKKKKA
jgi:hypothetical protein